MKSRTEQRNWLGLAWKASAIAAAIVLLVVAFGSRMDYTASAATTVVQVGQKADLSNGAEFNLNTVAIASGDTVSWEWFDGGHNTTPFAAGDWGTEISDGGNGATPGTSIAFFSGAANIYDVSFTNAGPGVRTVWYYCTLHASPGDIDTDAPFGVIDGSDTPDFGKMIGRIDVAAFVPDVTGPVTSGALSAPEPTDGAGVATLTATVDDTGTGGSNVAAAEYYIDSDPGEGSGTAMDPADAFDSATENVTAGVPVPAIGVYTLYVRGQDSEGNWGAPDSTTLTVTGPPAGAEDVSFTLTGGSLSVTTFPVAFGSLLLSAGVQTVDTTPTAWVGTDATGSAAGWHVTVSSTDLTSGGNTIVVDNLKLQLLDGSIATVSGNTKPASTATSYAPLSGSPQTIMDAPAGTGMGTYTFAPDFRLNVPGESVPGVYAALLTVTANSGPTP